MRAAVQDLQGKVALVTGSSRGIGRAIALALAARGAFVVVHYASSSDAAADVVARIEAAGGGALAVGADLSVPEGAQQLVDGATRALEQRCGSPAIDLLVNNAGLGKRAPIEEVTPEDFDRILQVNLKSPFFIIQKTLPFLRDGGRIVNVSSMGTRVAYPAMATYAPSKAGLEALTTLLAAHLGPRGITVNSVLPGATATDMNPATRDPEKARALVETIALRRIGQAEDIADVVVFLCTDAARWVTAQQIDASGGQRI